MPYTLDIPIVLGSSQTGLTLKAQLVDSSGVNVGSEVTTGFTEIGGGAYLWHYTAFPDAHRGGVKFYTGTLPSGFKAFAAINPEEGENTDVKTSSRLAAAAIILHSGALQAGSPVTLAADASDQNDFYAHYGLLVITSGDAAGQARLILVYDGTTKIVIFDSPLASDPQAGDEYVILAVAGKVDLSGDSLGEIQQQTADAVWGALTQDYTDAGTFGLAVGGLSELTDPLENQVPGDYPSGSAGAALGRIGTISIRVTATLTTGGDLTLVKGDDYQAIDGGAIDFTDEDSEASWVDLTDATVEILLQGTAIEGEVITPTGPAKIVRFELTAEQTAALSTDESRYAVRATLASENVRTLTRGKLIVYDNENDA